MKLLIPGPVSTRPAVREAAAQDYAPWDNDFRAVVVRVCERVRAIAGGRAGEHVALTLPGCGHFALEAACRTFVAPGGTILVPITGQYAERIVRLAREAGRRVVELHVGETAPVDPAVLAETLEQAPEIGHVALVYSETSSGIAHDVPALAAVAGSLGRRVIIDAVSAFGALPLDIGALPMVDAVVFTSNKCLEALPGASFTIARADRLEACAGQAGSWSFDLADLHRHYQRAPGAHRFTPAAGTIASIDVALDLFAAEGGQPARLARYTANQRALREGVVALGLSPYLPDAVQGPIVANVAAPSDPRWDLQRFVDGVKARGFVLSNFYNTDRPSFRVGCIGAITPDDMREAVAAMGETLATLGIAHSAAA